ncbi:MAG TPA: cbb3-type cytochrome c oxidase subunit II [Methylophilaceae bacterium]|nr:cbb3-type cytochrome c oxidase subunit II [Methylophilaceae bacterium]
MTRAIILFFGAMATLLFALVVLIILPNAMMSNVEAPPDLKPYTQEELLGRQVYIDNGCVYCHSQQVRDPAFTTDVARGWGSRPSVPADYVFDKPHLLGTMRTGPDLINVGVRLPDAQWHLLHLYQPRALVPWSIMPPYPFLFEHKETASPDDTILTIPEAYAPESGVVVVTDEARALVAYLLALKRDYPVSAQAPTPPEGETGEGEGATK